MNILIFGPNGSGKGTIGAILSERYNIPQIETGVIFRENIARKTELGLKAKDYLNKGELVPDEITIPMILNRLREESGKKGWLLDGFPRNINQAEAFFSALQNEGIRLDYVIELVLEREAAKKRIMGRRLCAQDNNHPNNIFSDEIKPVFKDGKKVCRICGSDLSVRADDQDESAIDKRHEIYFDKEKGTLAAIKYLKNRTNVLEISALSGIQDVAADLLGRLE